MHDKIECGVCVECRKLLFCPPFLSHKNQNSIPTKSQPHVHCNDYYPQQAQWKMYFGSWHNRNECRENKWNRKTIHTWALCKIADEMRKAISTTQRPNYLQFTCSICESNKNQQNKLLYSAGWRMKRTEWRRKPHQYRHIVYELRIRYNMRAMKYEGWLAGCYCLINKMFRIVNSMGTEDYCMHHAHCYVVFLVFAPLFLTLSTFLSLRSFSRYFFFLFRIFISLAFNYSHHLNINLCIFHHLYRFIFKFFFFFSFFFFFLL